MNYDKKIEKTLDTCLKKMFDCVGLKYPNEELTKHPNWFEKYTWTQKQQEEFSKWMKKILKKQFRYWNKKTIDMEVGMFVLNYGWKTSEEDYNSRRINDHECPHGIVGDGACPECSMGTKECE